VPTLRPLESAANVQQVGEKRHPPPDPTTATAQYGVSAKKDSPAPATPPVGEISRAAPKPPVTPVGAQQPGKRHGRRLLLVATDSLLLLVLCEQAPCLGRGARFQAKAGAGINEAGDVDGTTPGA
jgi:hypothetical protein